MGLRRSEAGDGGVHRGEGAQGVQVIAPAVGAILVRVLPEEGRGPDHRVGCEHVHRVERVVVAEQPDHMRHVGGHDLCGEGRFPRAHPIRERRSMDRFPDEVREREEFQVPRPPPLFPRHAVERLVGGRSCQAAVGGRLVDAKLRTEGMGMKKPRKERGEESEPSEACHEANQLPRSMPASLFQSVAICELRASSVTLAMAPASSMVIVPETLVDCAR